MKTLLILRHAHSSETQRGRDDKGRELSKEGINGALKIGSFIKRQGISIDKIISSSAKRAITTATIVANSIGYDLNNITEEEEFYMASIKTLMNYVNIISDDISSLIIIGHNPHLSYFAEYISKEIIEPFEPGGLAVFSLKIKSWTEVTEKSGDLLFFTSPTLLD